MSLHLRSDLQRSKWRGRVFAYAPLFLWIGVILFLGSGAGSVSETSRFVRPLLEFLFPAAGEGIYAVYHAFIRKFAHFFEYAILALLALSAFSRSTGSFGKGQRYILAAALVILVAAADEMIQSFLASRTGSAADVLLDISGGAFALIAWWLIASMSPRAKEV